MDRRELLRGGVLGAGVVLTNTSFRVIAGPFAQDDFPIPADKKLDPTWVRSLFERRAASRYTKAAGELATIGMPIGGIGAGQVYLGGDGRLWHWDVFNLPPEESWRNPSGPLYAKPATPGSPFEFGFAVRVDGGAPRPLDARGFADITFRGEYPIGTVEYRDPACPVVVVMKAYSPFVPCAADRSSHPAIVFDFVLRKLDVDPHEVTLEATLENPVCLRSGTPGRGTRHTKVTRAETLTLLECSATAPAPESRPASRAEILFDDFESERYEKWTATGTAFGTGPMPKARMPKYQGDVSAHGERLVNSHETRHGEDVTAGDAHVGTLLSVPFTIERHFVSFRIGGGAHAGKTCINLRVGDTVVRTATGHASNAMRWHSWDVRDLAGRTAQLEIVDQERGGWGNIGIDEIVFGDSPRAPQMPLEDEGDFGTFALALLAAEDVDVKATDAASAPFGTWLVSRIGWAEPAASIRTLCFTAIVAWHFPRVWAEPLAHLPDAKNLRRWYAKTWPDASAVARHVARELPELRADTFAFHDAWYDSTLPHWLLDRTLCNVSTLATSTFYRFSNGRSYGWEGNYCCPGTCTHVWNYAQAAACLFPELERRQRQEVDFGLAFDDASGVIAYRAEAGKELAVDGQAGTILRALREHQRAPDEAFLRAVWPRVKRAMECLIARDINQDGILDGAQYNTLDTAWFGEIAWISSLYVAALRACEAMAKVVADREFGERCAVLAARGTEALGTRLWNGEYFVQKLDPAHREANATGDGCHIDQMLGESWARQLGLPRVVAPDKARKALASLWRYSFALDIGPYRERFDKLVKGGRWYAMPGEGGMLMCTWPKKGIDKAAGKSGDAWAAGYFNECMTGFEWQVAAHMVWEGLVEQGLALARTIHDRYHPKKRNPFNEVECGNHYARAMASYGVFLAVCGFEYDGPAGHIGFAPRVSPERFKAAFTTADGWGVYEQTRSASSLVATITKRKGGLRLRTIVLECDPKLVVRSVRVTTLNLKNLPIESKFTVEGTRVLVHIDFDSGDSYLRLEIGA